MQSFQLSLRTLALLLSHAATLFALRDVWSLPQYKAMSSSKNFHLKVSHRILRHMHRVLNIEKN